MSSAFPGKEPVVVLSGTKKQQGNSVLPLHPDFGDKTVFISLLKSTINKESVH